MFEVLVYMFENYIDSQFRPDDNTLSKELSAAGWWRIKSAKTNLDDWDDGVRALSCWSDWPNYGYRCR